MNQMNLKEPDQLNWDGYASGSQWVAPPPALGPDGKPIVYFGQVPPLGEKAFGVTDEGYRQYDIDPITLVRAGEGVNGYKIRFTRVTTKKFQKNGTPIDASSVGNYLRACGITNKPQKNAEYDAAVKATQGKTPGFTVDWEARSKDTGEKIKGYVNFPDDPERPGQKKAILKSGDVYKDETGALKAVQAEVMFANVRVRYFKDPNRK